MKNWWFRTCVETYLTSRSHPKSFWFDILAIGIIGFFGVGMMEEPGLVASLTPAAGMLLYSTLTNIAIIVGHREVIRRIVSDPAKAQAWNTLIAAVGRCAGAAESLDRDKLTDEQRTQVLGWLAQAKQVLGKLEQKLGTETPDLYVFPEAQRAVMQINDLTMKVEALPVRGSA